MKTNKLFSLLQFSFGALLMVAPCSKGYAENLVIEVTDKFEGLGYKELAAQWWQWASSMSDDSGAVADTTGAKCGMEQSGSVWFLAGSYESSKVKRYCTVPAGKAIFFPVINYVYWDENSASVASCKKVQRDAQINDKEVSKLFVEIDGKKLENIQRFHVPSDCFDLYARLKTAQRPTEVAHAATDGYWILLSPLSKGQHTISFGGAYQEEPDGSATLKQDIEYVLTVE